jgi:hypothetical protein
METQTRYDLNAAIENWRQELAAQANLTAEVRRELETHLRDTIAGFQQRGLNDEESFWLARRRVGQPQQLGEEFVKADPAKVWRERVFWMAIALFMFGLWGTINGLLWGMFPDYLERSDTICVILRQTIFYAPIIWIVTSLALGRISKKSIVWSFLFRSRLSFVVIATPLFLGVSFLQMHIQLSHAFPHIPRQLVWEEWRMYLENLTQPCVLIALIAWLMPAQNRKAPKRV